MAGMAEAEREVVMEVVAKAEEMCGGEGGGDGGGGEGGGDGGGGDGGGDGGGGDGGETVAGATEGATAEVMVGVMGVRVVVVMAEAVMEEARVAETEAATAVEGKVAGMAEAERRW